MEYRMGKQSRRILCLACLEVRREHDSLYVGEKERPRNDAYGRDADRAKESYEERVIIGREAEKMNRRDAVGMEGK
jgi:hypothetical protein